MLRLNDITDYEFRIHERNGQQTKLYHYCGGHVVCKWRIWLFSSYVRFIFLICVQGVDCNGHGTHCAGTVAGASYGVAKSAKVYGVRTLSCEGSALTSLIINGSYI